MDDDRRFEFFFCRCTKGDFPGCWDNDLSEKFETSKVDRPW
jgi:hypothetical protein